MSPREPLRGDEPPRILVPPPGPRSQAAARRLRRAEGAAIWGRERHPIVWLRARGAVVEDLDGNRYVDLTSGFGVLSLGHAAPEVRRAIAAQAGRLTQGLGDLMPHANREKLARRLARLGGPRLSRVLFAATGSEAVELALKTALVATGRRRVVAFEGGYHGQSLGALSVTHHPGLRAPVERQLTEIAIHIPYAYPYRCPIGRACGGCDLACLKRGFETVDEALQSDDPPGAVIVEPIQGRSGAVIPPPAFLQLLCALARDRGLLVIYDEVLTGAGRTGPFWAWERSGPEAEPDLLVGGKGIGGGVAIAALWGRAPIMESWAAHVLPSGEAPHSSTFYAHPVACAGALRVVDALDRPEMRERVVATGLVLAEGLHRIAARHETVGEVRSAGLLGAIELVEGRDDHAPNAALLGRLLPELLREGVLAIPGGTRDNVLSLLPPLTIEESQLRLALDGIDRALERAGGRRRS